MVASIANFDQPKTFSSVKPPKVRQGTQTDFDSDSDYGSPGKFQIYVKNLKKKTN